MKGNDFGSKDDYSEVAILKREKKDLSEEVRELRRNFRRERKEREIAEQRIAEQMAKGSFQSLDPLMLKKIPPHDSDLEQIILGSFIKNPELIGQVDFSQPYLNNMFYRDVHRKLHTIMMKLGLKISVDHIISQIKADKWYLDEFGGLEGTKRLIKEITDTETVTDPKLLLRHIQKIESYFLRRSCIVEGAKIADFGYHGIESEGKEVVSVPEQIRELAKKLLDIIPFRFRIDRDLRTDVTQTYDEIKELIKRQGRPAVSTGYLGLDRICYGVGRDFLMVIGALSKVGKTTFALDIAENVAKQGKHVLYFAYNSSSTDLIQKLIARNAQIDSALLQYHEEPLTEEQENRVEEAVKNIKELPLIIERGPADLEYLTDRTNNLKRLYPDLVLVVVDELQSFGVSLDSKKHKPDVFYHVMLKLKEMSRQLRVTTIINAQLKQDVDKRRDKKPYQLSDLADCKGAGDVVDAAVALYAPQVHWPEKEEYLGWMSVIPLAIRSGEKKDKIFRLGYDPVTSNIFELKKN